jgi:hypothetical protein
MKRCTPAILTLLIFSISIAGTAQPGPGFSKPELSLDGNILVIAFDILNSQPAQGHLEDPCITATITPVEVDQSRMRDYQFVV